MRRLGIALHRSRWSWAVLERGVRGVRVVAVGEVEPGDWAAIGKRTRAERVAIALADRDVVVRRLQIGHPPSSRGALRQLVRWRLREDLPFAAADAAVDAVLLGAHSLALAAPRALVLDTETRAAALGRVDTISSESIAAFNLVRAHLEGGALLVHEGGYAEVSGTADELTGFTLRDGAPGRESEVAVRCDTRPDGVSTDLPGVDWSAVPADRRHLFASAVGVALPAADLNLASRPPASPIARRLAFGMALASIVPFVASGALAVSTARQARDAQAAIERVVIPAQETSVLPEGELAAYSALVAAPRPEWTRILAALERDLPATVTITQLDWDGRELSVTIEAPDERALVKAESILAATGHLRPASSTSRDKKVLAIFRGPGGSS